jgi:hypothetical protein
LPDCQFFNIFFMTKQLLTLILLVSFYGIATADKDPIKFGVINKSDLLNNVYAPDTSALAVVMCDYGSFTTSRFQTVRTLRIKILKKEGLSIANQSFQLDAKADIRGITYNLEGSEIVETKLKNESIFKTRITQDFFEMRVAMPNVKVGSIIDIQFTYYGLPRSWDFQLMIPVVHSELNIQSGPYLKFTKNFYGFIPLKESTESRWVAENMPAFKVEPFITSTNNYRTRIEFEPQTVRNSGYTSIMNYHTTTDWDGIRDLLLAETFFGQSLSSDAYMKKAAEEIKASGAKQDELIKRAYDYVKRIKWNKQERLITEKPLLNTVLKEGNGNSAEINLALIQLLRRLDFKAAPVVLSTRENGRLSTFVSSLYKLNYVIAAVIREKDTLLLDATEEHCPYDLLPLRALNGQGQYIDKSATGWVPVTTKKKDKQMVVYKLTVENDLSLKGKVVYLKGDYAALDFRNNYERFNSDEAYLTDIKSGKKGLKILSHKIDNLDSLYKPINEEFEITTNNSVNDIDGELYIIPLLFEQLTENPFQVAKREYPIDFGYAREKTIIVNYTIPQGYSVASLPADASLRLPENTASLISKSTITDNMISITYKFSINKSIFLPSEYADLREFYNQVIAKHAEPIVLKKI